MREYGVRRYGDLFYQHCLAESAADAASWFAHSQAGVADKDFQALVKDVTRPVNELTGPGANPEVIHVRRGPLAKTAISATSLNRTSPLHEAPQAAASEHA